MEQRTHNRFKCQSAFVLQHKGSATPASFSDVSAGGALISEAPELEAGDQVQLVLQLRSFYFLNCEATAIRSSDGEVALRFQNPLSEEQIALLVAA